VSIVALGCFHPVMKVQSASIHFFLGSDDEKEDSDDEEDEVSNVCLAQNTTHDCFRLPMSELFTIVVKSTKRDRVTIKSSRNSSMLQKRYPVI
jgi:hypothetical protein